MSEPSLHSKRSCSREELRNNLPRESWGELEHYSFEPMRESSGSEEEEATEREDSRRGNTTWCSCDFCLNWEERNASAAAR